MKRTCIRLTLTMPPRHRLTDDQRGRALAWLDEGLGQRKVARCLQMSHSVIQRLYQRFIETAAVQERQRSGRPRVTTRQEDLYLVLSILRERSATSVTLRGQPRDATGTNISCSTVRRRLIEQNLRSRRPAVQPQLSVAIRASHLAWDQEHVTWTRHQWARVLFSDEYRFALSFNDGRARVWRCPGERFIDATVQEHN